MRVRITTLNSIYEYDQNAGTVTKLYNNGRDLGFTKVDEARPGTISLPVVIPGNAHIYLEDNGDRLITSDLRKVEVFE
jgi:hypothetical protein